MNRFAFLTPAFLAIALAGCAPEGAEGGSSQVNAAPTPPDTATLANGRFGHVRYRYDPHVLTRADTELALPPDFTQTVNAVKFIPSRFVAKIGSEECSFGSEAERCTASQEVGFAIALLERPLIDYTTAIARSRRDMPAFEPVAIHGVEGVSITHVTDSATTRYTFLPIEGRTLMLVDRDNAGVQEATEALQQVRDSIAF